MIITQQEKQINCIVHMVADIMNNKKYPAVSKELFIRCRKINISLVFITQLYFSVLKEVR